MTESFDHLEVFESPTCTSCGCLKVVFDGTKRIGGSTLRYVECTRCGFRRRVLFAPRVAHIFRRAEHPPDSSDAPAGRT